jgi:hypothetical protein
MESDITDTVSKGIHEVIKESHARARDPFVFVPSLFLLWPESKALGHLTVILDSLINHLDNEFEALEISKETFLEERLNEAGMESVSSKYRGLETLMLELSSLLRHHIESHSWREVVTLLHAFT